MSSKNNILVIKHSALGDFIQALGPMQAIRAHHPDAHLTLLTTAPYQDLAEATGFFDDIWIDARPRLWQAGAIRDLKARLNTRPWVRIYDLQNSDRTGFYQRFLMPTTPKALWSRWTDKSTHTLDRQAAQLRAAGIPLDDVPLPSLKGLSLPKDGITVKKTPYALIIPGGAAHRPQKRWPADRFAEAARFLLEHNLTPILIGTHNERHLLETIAETVPEASDLCGQTSILDLASLALGATLALGNDTGPMHMAAAAGVPSVVLFSADSNPDLCAPRGDHVRILQKPDLKDLSIPAVLDTLSVCIE